MLSEFGIAVKVIEKDKDRCYYLSTHLDDVMILHGDATDTSLLEEENMAEMDAFRPPQVLMRKICCLLSWQSKRVWKMLSPRSAARATKT